MSHPARSTLSLRWRWLLPVAGLVLLFHFSPLGITLDRAFFDAASRHPLWAPPLPANSTLVLIDEPTLAAMSKQGARWPYSRLVFAQLTAALHQAGAQRVVMDFTFFEESAAAEQDLILATVCAAAPTVVLGRTKEQAPVFWDDAYRAAHPEFFRRPRTGLVEFNADDDGVARAYVVPGSLAAAACDPPPATPGGLLRWHGGLERISQLGVPVLSALGYIEFGQPIIDRLIAASPDLDPAQLARALAAEPPLEGADLVRGRIVFVGVNASGTYDLKPFPVGKLEPGLLYHWTAWTNLAAGGFITPAPRGLLLVLAALAGGLVIVAGQRHLTLLAPVAAAVAIAFVAIGGAYVAHSAGWFVPPSTPVFAVILTLLGVVAESFWLEQARKREIQSMFGAYVDPNVVATLVRNPAAIRLAGEKREATVFFSDLAGFTDLSEKLKDQPEKMVEVVNAYLDETSECLHNHGAYVDKYIGDAVMAVFGVPQPLADHAVAACLAALDAQRALAGINARYAAGVGVRLEVRIGLNTGEMIVGNLGSARKKNYTVMGDAVNLASRLEGANKEFGTHILLGETTARLVAGRLATRPLTGLRVKGKKEAVEVHELISRVSDLSAERQRFLQAYCAGYADYAARRFAEAAVRFREARTLSPDDRITLALLESAEAYAQNPPPADWAPILTLETK
ncbi:MAG: adenylate/guanylate cyclase domain-containing protein [Opitutaceae bacterium]|nr:adenylate/guanylate cyclase domain-containing protein [Opitutaceae bacterium]